MVRGDEGRKGREVETEGMGDIKERAEIRSQKK